MNVIQDISIRGMKQTDFMQLEEMFNHVLEEGIRWDRQDYWDARNNRLKEWLRNLNESLIGSKIQEKQ